MNTLNIIRREKYVICQIDHGKVNAIDQELSEELEVFFNEVETDSTIEGVILSGRPHCFSAGLNVRKLAQGVDYMTSFWRSHFRALQSMVRFSKPFIAAITGYAPAAGTTLACTADYRIMGRGEKHVIGMHEMKLSMVIPEMLVVLFAHWIGDQKAMECFLHSRLMQADEAVNIGLVNEAYEVDEVLPRAEELMAKWTRSYVGSTQRTKRFLKKDLIRKMNLDAETMIQDILAGSTDPIAMQKFVDFQKSL